MCPGMLMKLRDSSRVQAYKANDLHLCSGGSRWGWKGCIPQRHTAIFCPWKITSPVTSYCYNQKRFFGLKYIKVLATGPQGELYSAPPDPLAGFKGPRGKRGHGMNKRGKREKGSSPYPLLHPCKRCVMVSVQKNAAAIFFSETNVCSCP